MPFISVEAEKGTVILPLLSCLCLESLITFGNLHSELDLVEVSFLCFLTL